MQTLSNQPSRTAALRKQLGLPEDRKSDDIWEKRFKQGTHNFEQAQAAIQSKLNPQTNRQRALLPNHQVTEERRKLGLKEDLKSDTIWNKRIQSGQFTLADAIARLRGKAGPTQSRAADLVGMQYDPAESALQREIERIARERDHATQVQERYQDNFSGKLGTISSELQKLLGQNTQQIGGIYDRAGANVGQAYQGAQQAVAGASEDVRGDLIKQMQRLGLEEAGTDPLAELSKQAGNENARFAVSGANATSNLGRLGADMQAIGVQSQNDAAREGQQQQYDLAKQVLAQIGNIQHDAFNQTVDTQGQLSDVINQRGADIRNTLWDLEDQKYDRTRQESLDDLYRRVTENSMDIQNRNMGLAEGRYGMETEQHGMNMQTQRYNLESAKKQLEMQIAAANSPEARLAAQLDLAKIQAEINRINADIALKDSQIGLNEYKATPTAQQQDALRLGGQQGVQAYAGMIGDPGLYNDFLNMLSKANELQGTTGMTPAAAMQEQINSLPSQMRSIYLTAWNIFNKDYAGYAN